MTVFELDSQGHLFTLTRGQFTPLGPDVSPVGSETGGENHIFIDGIFMKFSDFSFLKSIKVAGSRKGEHLRWTKGPWLVCLADGVPA